MEDMDSIKDTEGLLRKTPLAQVPATLDEKVERTLQAATDGRRPWHSRPVPLWSALAAGIFCILLGYAASFAGRGPDTEKTNQTVIYLLEPDERLSSLLRRIDRRERGNFFQRKKTHVRTVHPVTPPQPSGEAMVREPFPG